MQMSNPIDVIISGLEFKTASDSVRIVNSWSYVKDNFPWTFRSILFTSPTRRSYRPPIQGAISTINCQLIPLSAVYYKTSGSRRHFSQALSKVDLASLNCEALSHTIFVGLPRLATNLRKQKRNCSAGMFLASSK